jgi:hypothetical protein
MQKINIGIEVDLTKLIASRLLIQASSGGGKSYAIRKSVEQLIGHVQVIIIDIEGEFVSLREKFPFALVSKEGEIPLNVRYAETLAHKLLETNLSAIIDMSEMEVHQRRIFAKRFLGALIESPKHLWHPCVVVIDEADFFAPEGKESESTRAVINLSSRGRKRGICSILATQRIAKLNKDATADILNKIIGLTGQDIDQKRAGNELGFATRNDVISLRNLKPGEFYAFGPAISNEVIKFKVGKTETTHTEYGQYGKASPTTPNAIKKILGKLSDIPEEAEKELTTKQQLQDEVKRLTIELKKKPVAVQTAPVISDTSKAEITLLKNQLQAERKNYSTLLKVMQVKNIHLEKAVKILMQVTNTELPNPEANTYGVPDAHYQPKAEPITRLQPTKGFAQPLPSVSAKPAATGGSMRMLKAVAMFAPEPITRTRMALLARLSSTSGSFNTYLSTLKRQGFITWEGNLFTITEEGLKEAGDIEPLPTDPEELINFWCAIIGDGGGAARMLRSLAANYPNAIAKKELGDAVGMSSTSGSFNTYISTLKRNGLIKVNGPHIQLSSELYN